MPKEQKIPVRVTKLVERVKSSGRLCVHNRPLRDGGSERHYVIEPIGRAVAAKSCRDAIDMGLLISMGDGLFSDADAQTWVAK